MDLWDVASGIKVVLVDPGDWRQGDAQAASFKPANTGKRQEEGCHGSDAESNGNSRAATGNSRAALTA